MSSNLKQQAGVIAFSTLLAGFSLASILNFTDPASATLTTFSFFYLSLFLLSLGSFTLLGLLLRKWLPGELYVNNLSNSFRQAFLISILIVISFFLLSKNLLFWWVEASIILLLVFLEAFLNLKI